MSADLTLVNLNLLFMRYGEQVERERHVPLGCLYLTRALEAAGFAVDFRDYQLCESSDPFDLETFLSFAADPAPVIGLSCMANLLPFTLLAAEALKARYHFNLEENVLPKLELLQRFGFYLQPERAADPNAESCGAHSPRVI